MDSGAYLNKSVLFNDRYIRVLGIHYVMGKFYIYNEFREFNVIFSVSLFGSNEFCIKGLCA